MAQWRHFGDDPAASSPTLASANNKSEGQLVTTRSSLAREILAAHNAVRVRVGTAPLTWSDRLAGVAQDWAKGLLASGQFVHSHNPNYGENLFEISGAAATPEQVVKAFADEVRDYDYKSNSCRVGAMCGHYTQVIWNDTREVGCSIARNPGREVWVCEYFPPGNWVGRRPY
jgi:pathogenesis-related protein 1